MTGTGRPERIDGVRVSSSLFPIFSARAAIGRVFSGEDPVGRLSLTTRVRKAVEQGSWVLHYQPIVDLHDGTVRGRRRVSMGKARSVAATAGPRFTG